VWWGGVGWGGGEGEGEVVVRVRVGVCEGGDWVWVGKTVLRAEPWGSFEGEEGGFHWFYSVVGFRLGKCSIGDLALRFPIVHHSIAGGTYTCSMPLVVGK